MPSELESCSSSSVTPHVDEPECPAEDEVKWLSFVKSYLRPAIKHGAGRNSGSTG